MTPIRGLLGGIPPNPPGQMWVNLSPNPPHQGFGGFHRRLLAIIPSCSSRSHLGRLSFRPCSVDEMPNHLGEGVTRTQETKQSCAVGGKTVPVRRCHSSQSSGFSNRASTRPKDTGAVPLSSRTSELFIRLNPANVFSTADIDWIKLSCDGGFRSVVVCVE